MKNVIRLFIVDDHAIVREGLRTLLSEHSEVEIVGEAENGRESLAEIEIQKPDVVLLDLVMPEMGGIETIHEIKRVSPQTQILILTSFVEEEKVKLAIQAGAIGYLLKDILQEQLVQAIRQARSGCPTLHPEAQKYLMRQLTPQNNPLENLTERETDVLRLLAQGKSNKEIANTLKIREGTVKSYVSAILMKIDVSDRTQAALFAVKQGLE